MKKIVSLLIALTLLVSLFAVTSVAYAADPDPVFKGVWTDADYENLGSRINFSDNKFDGSIYYVSIADGSSTLQDSVSGKYTIESGNLVVSDVKPEGLQITYDSVLDTLAFNVTEEDEEHNITVVYNQTLARHCVSHDTESESVFASLEEIAGVELIQAASTEYQFALTWLKDVQKVEKIFKGIHYVLKYGEWEVVNNLDDTLSVKYDVFGYETNGTLNKVSAESSDEFAGEWSGTVGTREVWMSFGATTVVLKIDGLSVGSPTYTVDSENTKKATFTSGSEEKPYAIASGSDQIYLQYCQPTYDSKDDSSWVSRTLNLDNPSTTTIGSTGWWSFRFVAADSKGHILTDTEGNYVHTNRMDVYFLDEKAPTIKSIPSDMETLKESGLTVGNKYTIKTSVNYESGEISSKTVYYTVYKFVNNEWVEIFDSKKGEITEGYEDCISTSGVITVLESDVLPDSGAIYKVEYRAFDKEGYPSTNVVSVELFAKEATTEESSGSNVQAWQIVLYVIAGLSAVGIIVVLCIKPKNAEKVDSRVANTSDDSDKNNQQ